MIRLVIVLLICSLNAMTLSAQKTILPAPTFTIINAEETMPVWVHGNLAANCILLAVHGGPGSDVLDFRNYKGGIAFKLIEEEYQVAYWQQRASGQSFGSDDKSYFTIEQYVEDLDKVIDEIKIRYPNKKIALFGHSWGGMLTSSYLKNHFAKVDAWINAAGVTDGRGLFTYSQYDIYAEADNRISQNENISYWQEVKQQLKDSNANALAYAVTDKIPEVKIKVNLGDFKFTKRALTSNGYLFRNIVVTNNSDALKAFNKPALILWGQYDYAVSKQIRDAAINDLSSAKVTNILLPESGHFMMFHQPELFAESIINCLQEL